MKLKFLLGCLLMLPFCGLFGALTGWHVRHMVTQDRATSFPSVQGEITSASVHRYSSSRRGPSYSPSFRYTYEVEGSKYTGSRYRYGGAPSFHNYSTAQKMVNRHPEGSEITVYYNPADPRDAMLSTGVDLGDVGTLFLLLPLNILFWFVVLLCGGEFIRSLKPAAPAGGVKIINERMTWRVRLPQYDPVKAGLITFCAISLLAGFFLNYLGQGYPVLAAGILTTALCVLGTGGVYLWFHTKIASGTQDLVIDENARTLQLPLTYKRKSRLIVAFSEVIDLDLKKVPHRGRYGTVYTYAPTLHLSHGHSQQLTDLKKEQAEAFVEWLREKIKLAPNELTTG